MRSRLVHTLSTTLPHTLSSMLSTTRLRTGLHTPLQALSVTALAIGLVGGASNALADEPLPAPVQALTQQGLEIHERFDAPGGLTGFGASARGQEMAVYLTPDGDHAIVGTMMDASGNNLTESQLDKYVREPLDAETWERLADSHWIQDGDPDAPRVIYTFTDANCPYCQQLWEAARPWVRAGRVQMRHIMVGILADDSPAKAATLLADDDPARALKEQKEGGSIAPDAQPARFEEQVYDNNQLFESLGLYATPTSAYRRDGGSGLEKVQGMPNRQDLIEMMGSEAP